jgi:hypothetical protein
VRGIFSVDHHLGMKQFIFIVVVFTEGGVVHFECHAFELEATIFD